MVETQQKAGRGMASSPMPGTMTESDFREFRRLIEGTLGIRMPQHKKTMLEGRLRRRLREQGLDSFAAYRELVCRSGEAEPELRHLFDAVTTNKTDFFREPAHFKYLSEQVLPQWLRSEAARERPLRLWSAGCSSGEEPYTLAMVLSEFGLRAPEFRFAICATDISTKVLQEAELGIYRTAKVEPVPLPLRQKYLRRSRDPQQRQVRVAAELRSKICFSRLNLMDDEFPLNAAADVIFCRNVIIYFDRPTQEALLRRLCRVLAPGGYLFIGHSETLNGMELPLQQVAPTIYRQVDTASQALGDCRPARPCRGGSEPTTGL